MHTTRRITFEFAPRTRWTNICRPDDQHKTLVDEKGRLLYDFRRHGPRNQFARVVAIALHGGVVPTSVRQWTEEAGVPIVHTHLVYPRLTLELASYGHADKDGNRTDVVTWTVNAQESEQMSHVELELFEPDGQQSITLDGGNTILRDGKPILLSSELLSAWQAENYSSGAAFATKRFMARPGASVTGVFVLPLGGHGGPVPSAEVGAAEKLFDAGRRFWRGQRLIRNDIQIPDRAIMEMLIACARNIFQAREVKDGVPEFQVGATLYRGLWVVDGHFILEAAQYLGYAEEAAAGIRALDKRVRADGSIAEFDYHTKETGIALFTLVRQAELAGNDSILLERWDVIRHAVAFIDSLREKSRADGADVPYYGLMPPSLGDGGVGGIRPEYTTTLWTLVGLKAIAATAERLGKHDDAAEFSKSYRELRGAFDAAAKRDMQKLPDGTPFLSMVMPGGGSTIQLTRILETTPEKAKPEGPWDELQPLSGTWALAHAVSPGELFDDDEPIVRNFCHLLAAADHEEGVPEGSGWAPYRSLWNYAASFYAHTWLWSHRGDKAADYLYAFANHATPTRVWREEQALKSSDHGYWIGDMPHNWASAEFIRLVRHLLVFERGDELELFPGLPVEWVVAGNPLILNRTPTRYGAVSISLKVSSDGSLEVLFERVTNTAIAPKRITLFLAALNQLGLSGVKIEGGKPLSPGTSTIELPATASVRISGQLCI